MIKNVGRIDRLIRMVVGVVLLAAPLMNKPAIWENPFLAYGAIAVGLILCATAVFGMCPVYSLFGISKAKS